MSRCAEGDGDRGAYGDRGRLVDGCGCCVALGEGGRLCMPRGYGVCVCGKDSR